MAIMSGENFGKRKKEGLVFGGKYLFECSSCDKELLNLIITRPNADLEGDYKCKCPYCGSYSKIKNIKGGFALEGIASIDDKGHEVIHTMPKGDYDVLSDGTVVINVIKL